MKRSLSIQFKNGCVQVNHSDIKCDTKSSFSITVVHGKAGTLKSTMSEISFGSGFGRVLLFSDSCNRLKSVQASINSGVFSSLGRSMMSSINARSSSKVPWPRMRLTICAAQALSLSCRVKTNRSNSLPFSSRLSNFLFRTRFRRWSPVSSMPHSRPVLWQLSHGNKPEHYAVSFNGLFLQSI